MSVANRKTRLYVKLVLIALVVVMVVAVLFKNRNHHTAVWFFKEYQDVNVLKLLLVTAVLSIFSFWILSMVFKLSREWRELAKQTAHEEQVRQLDDKAQALAKQERHIDAKIDKALSEPKEE